MGERGWGGVGARRGGRVRLHGLARGERRRSDQRRSKGGGTFGLLSLVGSGRRRASVVGLLKPQPPDVKSEVGRRVIGGDRDDGVGGGGFGGGGVEVEDTIVFGVRGEVDLVGGRGLLL